MTLLESSLCLPMLPVRTMVWQNDHLGFGWMPSHRYGRAKSSPFSLNPSFLSSSLSLFPCSIAFPSYYSILLFNDSRPIPRISQHPHTCHSFIISLSGVLRELPESQGSSQGHTTGHTFWRMKPKTWSVVLTEQGVTGYLEPDGLFWKDGLQIQNSPHPRRGLQKLSGAKPENERPKKQPPVVKLDPTAFSVGTGFHRAAVGGVWGGVRRLPENGVREKWMTSGERAEWRGPFGKPSWGRTFMGGVISKGSLNEVQVEPGTHLDLGGQEANEPSRHPTPDPSETKVSFSPDSTSKPN